jgi:hypothetical protein
MFDVYAQIVPDSLHCADTGLFQSILITIFHSLKTTFYTASNFGGEKEAEKLWDAMLLRLKVRLSRWTNVGNTTIGKFVSIVGYKVSDAVASAEGSNALFKASDYRLLMLVNRLLDSLFDRL